MNEVVEATSAGTIIMVLLVVGAVGYFAYREIQKRKAAKEARGGGPFPGSGGSGSGAGGGSGSGDGRRRRN